MADLYALHAPRDCSVSSILTRPFIFLPALPLLVVCTHDKISVAYPESSFHLRQCFTIGVEARCSRARVSRRCGCFRGRDASVWFCFWFGLVFCFLFRSVRLAPLLLITIHGQIQLRSPLLLFISIWTKGSISLSFSFSLNCPV